MKYTLHFPLLASFFVYSLPMRNWNYLTGDEAEEAIRFIVYLWGIEIYNSAHIWVWVHLVYSLPMRNWNGFEVYKIDSVELGL